jgi:hypothetical protein
MRLFLFPKVIHMAKKDMDLKADISTEISIENIQRPKFNFYLIVVNPFETYFKGQRVQDDATIQWIIDNHYLHNCNKCNYQS